MWSSQYVYQEKKWLMEGCETVYGKLAVEQLRRCQGNTNMGWKKEEGAKLDGLANVYLRAKQKGRS